jgi:hypothetical protein
MSQPIPDGSATLERHGIRGIEGPNRMQQLAPLNQQYSGLEPELKWDANGQPQTEEGKLRVLLEMGILHDLLGASLTDPEEGRQLVEHAYRRTFDEWLSLFASERPEVDRLVLMRQFATAWHNVEELLTKNPR